MKKYSYWGGWIPILGAGGAVIAGSTIATLCVYLLCNPSQSSSGEPFPIGVIVVMLLFCLANISFGLVCGLRMAHERIVVMDGEIEHRSKFGTVQRILFAEITSAMLRDVGLSKMRRLVIYAGGRKIVIYGSISLFDELLESVKLGIGDRWVG